MKTLKVVIAASGSGGHLFPALYIAQAFKRYDPNISIEFFVSGRPLEEKILKPFGAPLNVISFKGIQGCGIWGKIRLLWRFPIAFIQTWQHFERFKPDIVIGVGGYASVMPLIVGKIKKIVTLAYEAEMNAGEANKFLSSFVDIVATAFPSVKGLSSKTKVINTGHPIREEIKRVNRHNRVDEIKNVLVTGGSQGAEGLDHGIFSMTDIFSDKKLFLKHQVRPENVEIAKKVYNEAGVNAEVLTFIDDMASAYDWADILICRSGAGSVMEVSAVNRPTIFVPYPHAQGQHQKYNAKILVDAGKALMVEQGDGFNEKLKEAFNWLLDIDNYQKMKEVEYQSPSLNASDKIVEEAVKMVP